MEVPYAFLVYILFPIVMIKYPTSLPPPLPPPTPPCLASDETYGSACSPSLHRSRLAP